MWKVPPGSTSSQEWVVLFQQPLAIDMWETHERRTPLQGKEGPYCHKVMACCNVRHWWHVFMIGDGNAYIRPKCSKTSKEPKKTKQTYLNQVFGRVPSLQGVAFVQNVNEQCHCCICSWHKCPNTRLVVCEVKEENDKGWPSSKGANHSHDKIEVHAATTTPSHCVADSASPPEKKRRSQTESGELYILLLRPPPRSCLHATDPTTRPCVHLDHGRRSSCVQNYRVVRAIEDLLRC